ATRNVYDTGDSVMLNIFTPVPEQVAWLQREQPYYLLTHPSVLNELALYCKRNSIQFPFLGEVRTISESLPDHLRELCHEVWGVPLVDVYSTIELGYLALQCPDHAHYHVQSEGVFLEVLNENNQPCASGEIGRVIVTSLHNFAFPLIRYEVGDYAEVGEPCSCGRGLPVIKRILGRYRNMLTLPSGEKRYPQLGIQDLYKIAPIQQFQAIQRSLGDIEINIVLPRSLLESEHEKLIEKFQKMFGTSFTFSVNQVEHIQRSVSGKYEEFISCL
ncbi:MAG TPA: phenylacetate--CoA ligase family protein, partial [Gammaproteobacteria bacterium]